jgi:hypothetical protein
MADAQWLAFKDFIGAVVNSGVRSSSEIKVLVGPMTFPY